MTNLSLFLQIAGHTRTISIPGCVKFNISTNACRGYCMSYSIPSNEDIGPFEQLELEPETTTTALPSRAQLVATYPDGQLVVNYLDHRSRQRRSLAWLFSDNPQRKPPNNREEFLKVPDQMQASASTKTVHNLRGDSTSPAAASGGQKRTSERQLGKLTLDSSLVDAIMGSIADGKRRDVVSVSQCCNMMEAEEVSTWFAACRTCHAHPRRKSPINLDLHFRPLTCRRYRGRRRKCF